MGIKFEGDPGYVLLPHLREYKHQLHHTSINTLQEENIQFKFLNLVHTCSIQYKHKADILASLANF